MAGEKKNNIEKYRKQIDRLDDQILDLLADRANIVKKVGETKSLKGSKKSIIRPGREAEMIRRIAKRQDGNALPRAAIAQMWRLIISSAINIEEDARVSAFAPIGERESFWLAREYFGSFTPMKQCPTAMEVFQDVVSEQSTVGVLPLWEKDTTVPWWVRMAGDKSDIRIFARLPFVQMAPSEKVPLVAIGNVEPEATGEDESMWVIKCLATVGFASVEGILKDMSVDFSVQQETRIIGNPTTHQYLVKMDGFVDKKSRKIANFVKKANDIYENTTQELVSAHWLGSYATPILFTEEKNISENKDEQ